MRGFANCLDLQPDEASMCEDQLKLGKLGDDRAMRMEALRQIHRTHACILLINHCSENDIATKTLLLRFSDCDHTRGQTTLHIIGTASIHATIFDRGLMRISHACYSNCIHVAIENQGFSATSAARDPNDIRSSCNRLDEFHFQIGVL